MRNIVSEVKNTVLINQGFTYKLRNIGPNIWTIQIFAPNRERSAKVEIIVDEYENPEDRGARGAIFRYGDISRTHVNIIMNSIMERL